MLREQCEEQWDWCEKNNVKRIVIWPWRTDVKLQNVNKLNCIDDQLCTQTPLFIHDETNLIGVNTSAKLPRLPLSITENGREVTN